jgi:hypothetical protein
MDRMICVLNALIPHNFFVNPDLEMTYIFYNFAI